MTHPTVQRWHEVVRNQDTGALAQLIAEDAAFYSPVVHAPQRGKALTCLYLGAAFKVFFNDTFRYVREVSGPNDAVLEFEVEINGILVNGVDLLKLDAAGKIVEFKVMLRPLKAINLIHERMGEMLRTMRPA
jgi:ketosteroid isomerase-like protein